MAWVLGVEPSLISDKPHSCSLPQFSHSCSLTFVFDPLSRHSPFRQHKTKDKHEIDRMTLTMVSVRVTVHSVPERKLLFTSLASEPFSSPKGEASCPAASFLLCVVRAHTCWGPGGGLASSAALASNPPPEPRALPGLLLTSFFSLSWKAVELPDSFSPELRSLLEGLLQRDVNRRLGCLGRG